MSLLLVYLPTLAGDIGIEDNPELAAAAYELGVPHPTGYPLYTLLGHGAIRLLPFGRPVYRMNVFAAFTAACAAMAVYALARLVCRRRVPASIAAILFGSSTVFWNQVAVADVFSLSVALSVTTLYCLLLWDRTGRAAPLRCAALAYGLGLTHHATAALLAPGLLFVLLTSRHRRTALTDAPRLAGLVLAPLLLYLYLPWAASRDPVVNFGDPRTLPEVWAHMTGRRFRHLMGTPSLSTIAAACRDCLPFSGPAPWIAGLGLLDLAVRRRRYLALFAISASASIIHAASYKIPNSMQYVLIVHVYAAVAAGCGLRRLHVWLVHAARHTGLLRRYAPRLGAAYSFCVLALACTMVAGGFPAAAASGPGGPGPAARTALSGLPVDSLVIVGGMWYQPLIYAQAVEGRRRDTILIYVADLQYRPYLPMVERLSRRGVRVVVPSCYRRNPTHIHPDDCVIRSIVTNNLSERPICAIGLPLAGLEQAVPDCKWLSTPVRGLYRTAVANGRPAGSVFALARPAAPRPRPDPRPRTD